MTLQAYLHGYSPQEQLRLVEQAAYWKETILSDLLYKPGESLLDVGCGVGAVLGVIAAAHPTLSLAGIDLEPRQIIAAQKHLGSLGVVRPDLRTGDASALPWADHSFDHAYMMWFIEHVRKPLEILREVRRVLKPGGTITMNETEYSAYHVLPKSDDWDHLEQAMHLHFDSHGNANAGLQLGTLLVKAGFSRITNSLSGCHFFSTPECDALQAHTSYTADYLEPAIPEFVRLGFDSERLQRGVKHLRTLHTSPDGSFTQMVYRARAYA